jgi:hypothetical protein
MENDENKELKTSESVNTNASTNNLVLDMDSFNSVMKFSEMMAKGQSTLPKHLQGNPSDCAAVIMQSMQWGMNPYAVAQKTHLVSGVLGYEAQLINAVITSLAPTTERLKFEWYGNWEGIIGQFKEVASKTKKDDYGNFKKFKVPNWNDADEKGLGVKVWATIKGESEPRTLDLLLTQARTRNSTMWVDDPKQQLAYLAIKKWSRLHCPDVIMGVYTPDELEEQDPIVVNPDETPQPVAAKPEEKPAETGAIDGESVALLTPPMLKHLREKGCEAYGIDELFIAQKFEAESLDDIPAVKFEEVKAAIKEAKVAMDNLSEVNPSA